MLVSRTPPSFVVRACQTSAPSPALPPCLTWRVSQAKLARVTQEIQTLERITAPEPRWHPFRHGAPKSWCALATAVLHALEKPSREQRRPQLLLQLEASREQAQLLDDAILIDRIAALEFSETEQMAPLLKDGSAVQAIAPNLARFFGAMPMDTTVGEAYLASLELIACEAALHKASAAVDTGATGEAVAATRTRARRALDTCDFALYWFGLQDDELLATCQAHEQELGRWWAYFA